MTKEIKRVSGSQVTGLPEQDFSEVDISEEEAKEHLQELFDEHREMLIESIDRLGEIHDHPDVGSLRTRLEAEGE